MRKIRLVHTDFDNVSKEKFEFNEEGYLITQNVALSRNESAILYYVFNTAVVDDAQSVSVNDANIINFDIGGAVAEIDIEELANMTLADLGRMVSE
ncbi:hypothetical protein [Psychrobacillus sp. L3]|uniref:hypothetical protein n=1 Tax=Psychrobacillus sp. L3 TaxID=3236891 RepID=UPI0036F2AD55